MMRSPLGTVSFDIFRPQPDNLLRCVSRKIDDAMLREIAAADYGYDVEKHLQHLQQIRNDGSFATPMQWEPREVLELIRWSEPDDPEWKPGGRGKRGHWMRAFACAALLRAAGDAENERLRDGWNQTLIQLIDSLGAVGSDLSEPASALLAWLLLKFEVDADAAELGFFGVGLLWFSLHHRKSLSNGVIVSLSRWIVARERHDRENGLYDLDGWLLGTTNFDLRHASWKRLGTAFQKLDLKGRSADARDMVKFIGAKLARTD